MARDKEDSADIGKKGKSGKSVKDMLAGYSAKFWVNSALGKPMLLIGIMLVVLARGCDAVGMRSVAKADAAYQQEMITFNFEFDAKSSDLKLKKAKKYREIADVDEKTKQPDVKQ